jgi:hypothetical protein
MILDILERIQDFDETNITTTPHKDLKMGDTSYTIAKKDIYMCLVDINGQIHPIDHILFAFVHELAHVANRTEQHDD